MVPRNGGGGEGFKIVCNSSQNPTNRGDVLLAASEGEKMNEQGWGQRKTEEER